MPNRKLVRAALALPLFIAAVQPANAACKMIKTAAQLQAVQNDLAGSYCLANDIDLGSIANFAPITSFSGTLDGRNHVIRNLAVSSTGPSAGLFAAINGGTIKNVRLVNAKIKSSGMAGVLAGQLSPGTVRNVHVDGRVKSTGSAAGGLVGSASGATTLIENSSSAARVSATGSHVGGLAGDISGGKVHMTFVTGRVECDSVSFCGGLVGSSANLDVVRSYTAGNVTCAMQGGFCGGLAGSADGGTVTSVYATGSVRSPGGFTGGLVGAAANGTVRNVFAAGATISPSGFVGGLFGNNNATVTNGYWDTETTGQSSSSNGGTGLTTAQMQTAGLTGFGNQTVWGITPGLSYPYLNGLAFKSTLASLVVSSDIYTLLPVSQLEKSNYAGATNHIDRASLAACYTMIARAISETRDVATLRDVAIDKYFWNDASRTAIWQGPVTHFATLGTLNGIAANTSLDNNVVAAMKMGQLVLLRGVYQDNGANVTAWMLGTLFTSDDGATPIAVIANDPFTGWQVAIDPATKMVTMPGFPLINFKLNGYQPVTIKP